MLIKINDDSQDFEEEMHKLRAYFQQSTNSKAAHMAIMNCLTWQHVYHQQISVNAEQVRQIRDLELQLNEIRNAVALLKDL